MKKRQHVAISYTSVKIIYDDKYTLFPTHFVSTPPHRHALILPINPVFIRMLKCVQAAGMTKSLNFLLSFRSITLNALTTSQRWNIRWRYNGIGVVAFVCMQMCI